MRLSSSSCVHPRQHHRSGRACTYAEVLTPEEADKEIPPRLRVKGSRHAASTISAVNYMLALSALEGKSSRWKNITKESQVQLKRRLSEYYSGSETDESIDENEKGEVKAATSALLALKEATRT